MTQNNSNSHNREGRRRYRDHTIGNHFFQFIGFVLRHKRANVIILLSNVAAVLIIAFLPHIIASFYGGTIPDFSFGAAGDWGCNTSTKITVNSMKSISPQVILGLGDYSYNTTADCWLYSVQPIYEKMKIAIGNHDDTTPSKLHKYMNFFNLTNEYYSFNRENVHFLALSTESPVEASSQQFNFAQDDLSKASSNESINWIVVYFHKPMYTSPSVHAAEKAFRDLYHPLFDKFGVDLVLYGHNHNYQRTYPLEYNVSNPSRPVIAEASKDLYNESTMNNSQSKHPIFLTVGTAGKSLHPIHRQSPFIVYQYEGFGFLDVLVTDDGHAMKGVFHANDGTMRDRFTIEK